MRALLAALVFLLAAGSARAETVLHRGNGAEPDTLDPAQAGIVMEIAILGDLMEGLVTRDAAARPIPGIAERWETSPDGLTWTFHLRKCRWSDGTPLVAQDFVAAWRRLLDPRTGARGAPMLWIVKNGRAISGGKAPVDKLGVAAPDPATVVVTLEHPAPYLPELLTQPAALPLPAAVIAKGVSVKTYLSNGPYLLKEWVPGEHIALAKNPRFYDAARVKIDRVNYYPTADTDAALRRFRAGELDMQTPLPAAQIPFLKQSMPGALHILPSLALNYIALNLRDPALKDIRIRRALNLIYDREAVTQKVMKLGERAAYAYVPPNMTGYAGGPQLDFMPLTAAARLTQARRLMQDAGFGPFNKLTLTYSAPGTPDSRRLAAIFQAMARQIYVDIRIQTMDYAILLRDMRRGQYQLGYTNWLADFDDAGNFLDLLRSSAPSNYAGYKNPAFDALLDKADRESDGARRAGLLKQAEALAQRDMPWLPIRFVSQTELVAPKVGGYVPNAGDFNRSRWLWVR